MSSPSSDVPNSSLPLGLTGRERMDRLAMLERIRLAMREVVVRSLGVVARDVPAEHQDWVYDLRRGQKYVGGGTIRFFSLLAGRVGAPNGLSRRLARQEGLRILELERAALDVLLPEDSAPSPTLGEDRGPENRELVRRLRIVKPTPAKNARVIIPSRRVA